MPYNFFADSIHIKKL